MKWVATRLNLLARLNLLTHLNLLTPQHLNLTECLLKWALVARFRFHDGS